MKREILCLLALASAVGCSAPDSLQSAQPLAVAHINATLTPQSRVAITPSDNSDAWHVAWVDGDALGGVAVDDSEATFFDKFKMVENNGSNATFEGAATEAPTRFVYPYNSEATIIDSHYTLDLSTQSADMELPFDALSSCVPLISSEAVYITTSTPSIGMMHLATAVTLNMRFSSLDTEKYDYLFKSVLVGCEEPTADHSDPRTTAQIDLCGEVKEETIYSDSSYGQIEVDIDNSPAVENYDPERAAETTYGVNFATLPFTIEPGNSLGIEWHLYRQNKETKGVNEILKFHSITNSGDESIALSRAEHSYVNCNLDATGHRTMISIDVGFND